MPSKPETEPATSSAAWGGQIESTMSLLAASSATEPASSSPDSAARLAVSALRPSEAQRTSWPRDRRTAPTAEPISPGAGGRPQLGVCATVPITLVPHTHWDREWYLPFEGFRHRLIPVMDELLDLLDRGYPHFHLDDQTALIDDYLEIRPEREQDIRRHAEAGRISVGPWLTLVDEFLVSGETILRSLELGLARARELGGGDLVGYLPDQFGHVGQMPQILRTAGIDNAVVWRGVPAAIDRTVFRWEAPDGSEVLAEYLPFGSSLGGALGEVGELGPALERLESWPAPFSARERSLVMAGGATMSTPIRRFPTASPASTRRSARSQTMSAAPRTASCPHGAGSCARLRGRTSCPACIRPGSTRSRSALASRRWSNGTPSRSRRSCPGSNGRSASSTH